MNKKRTFILGDEWLYFKVYTGYKTADTILTDTIYPLSQFFLKEKLIDRWFFIRYSDPQFHLRVRFHFTKKENILPIINNLNITVQSYVNQNLVWKIQTDTYQREIERYGEELIEHSEKLFHLGSEMICKTITLDSVIQDESQRWLLGLKMIDVLLTDFNYSLQEKRDLLNTLQDNYRLFRTQQRTHELILYDYLFRYYNSLIIRQKTKL
jgi:thiopeptide-type bacteriocin biosynthesis protein